MFGLVVTRDCAQAGLGLGGVRRYSVLPEPPSTLLVHSSQIEIRRNNEPGAELEFAG